MSLQHAKVKDTLIYYDRPLLFSAIAPSGALYLAVLVDDEDGTETWLYAPISEGLLAKVCSGLAEVRDGFSGRPCVALKVTSEGITETMLDDVPEEWLPDKGCLLRVKTETSDPMIVQRSEASAAQCLLTW